MRYSDWKYRKATATPGLQERRNKQSYLIPVKDRVWKKGTWQELWSERNTSPARTAMRREGAGENTYLTASPSNFLVLHPIGQTKLEAIRREQACSAVCRGQSPRTQAWVEQSRV